MLLDGARCKLPDAEGSITVGMHFSDMCNYYGVASG